MKLTKSATWKIVAGIIVVAGLAIYGVYKFANGPETGSVQVEPPQAVQPAGATNTNTVFDGPYMSFIYSKAFVATKADAAVKPVLANYNFIKQQFGSWQLAIQITQLPSGDLRDLGVYNYRLKTPAQYAFTTQQISGQTIPISTDVTNASFNKIAYLQHGDLAASVSLLGGNGQDDAQLQAALTTILTTWQWN